MTPAAGASTISSVHATFESRCSFERILSRNPWANFRFRPHTQHPNDCARHTYTTQDDLDHLDIGRCGYRHRNAGRGSLKRSNNRGRLRRNSDRGIFIEIRLTRLEQRRSHMLGHRLGRHWNLANAPKSIHRSAHEPRSLNGRHDPALDPRMEGTRKAGSINLAHLPSLFDPCRRVRANMDVCSRNPADRILILEYGPPRHPLRPPHLAAMKDFGLIPHPYTSPETWPLRGVLIPRPVHFLHGERHRIALTRSVFYGHVIFILPNPSRLR